MADRFSHELDELGWMIMVALQVYAYSVEYGRILGSFVAHDDTVSCLCIRRTPAILLTGSHDGTVKAWRFGASVSSVSCTLENGQLCYHASCLSLTM